MGYREWYGNEWQDYCLTLLRARYVNHDLQEIPDKHKGDLGLEAFTHDGTAFQCYAAQEPLSVHDLWERQRDKLTNDLRKLRNNQSDLKKTLGAVKVRRYVFMVHRHESRFLTEHAQTKASEVLTWSLPFIAPDFCITVETDENYTKERGLVCSIPEQLIDLRDVDDTTKDQWRTANLTLLDDARRKLRNLDATDAGLEVQLNALLDQYLTSENGLESLRSRYPDTWRTVAAIKSAKEKLLVLEYPADSIARFADVRTIANDLAGEIVKTAPSVSETLARTIAWGSVAEWLLRCPLNFEESA